MLESSDVGALFATMQANYGYRWPHKADAIPIWQHKLRRFSRNDIMRAADRATDTDAYRMHPPSAGEFADIVRESMPALPPPSDGERSMDPELIYAYCRPEGKSNPQGNPHRVSLQEATAQRRTDESVEDYRRRISDAITLAKYPHLGFDGRSSRPYY